MNNITYKNLKDIPITERKLFLKSFIKTKNEYSYRRSDIKYISTYVIKAHIFNNRSFVEFCINYFSKRQKQLVQSGGYTILYEDYKKLKKQENKKILNKKLKKVII